jgi:hypothetical protein
MVIREISAGEVKALVEQARDAKAMAEVMLEMDSTSRLIPAQERSGLISMALRSGREWAQELRKRYPEADTLILAQKLGVEVKYSDQEGKLGNIVLRSEYYDQPPQIVIYNSSVKALQEVIERTGHTDLLPLKLLVPIHVAHELFHHLENLKKDHLSQRYKVATLRIGRWRLIESGVRVLTEIGAQAFVQAWLKLSWNPFVLDQIEMLIGGDVPSPIDHLNELIKRPRWVSKINKKKGKDP